MPPFSWIMIAGITLTAGFIQSVTGFGFGIFAMIFLPIVVSYGEASALSSILSSLSSLVIALPLLRRIHWKNLLFPLLGSLPLTFAAVAFVKTQTNEVLTLLLGVALFLLSVYFYFFSHRVRIRPTWYAGLTAGLISGVMSGLFAVGGPPVVVYFLQSEENPDQYLATISAYFVLAGVFSVAAKTTAGFVTGAVLIGTLIGIAAMLLSALIGKRVRGRIRADLLKKVIYGVMALSGAINVVTALM